MSASVLYFEDLHAGDRYEHGSVEVSAATIKRFAARYDPQPFHLDEAAARSSLFGRLAAPGWLSTTLIARLLTDGPLYRYADIGSPGLEDLRWRRPVCAGDRLRVHSTCLATDTERGSAQLCVEAFNQDGELATRYTSWIVLARRQAQA